MTSAACVQCFMTTNRTQLPRSTGHCQEREGRT